MYNKKFIFSGVEIARAVALHLAYLGYDHLDFEMDDAEASITLLSPWVYFDARRLKETFQV